MTTFLWVVLPYVALAVFFGGLWWRYHYDKFGWTTRSSQLYENRLLRIGSPLFHIGLLMAIVGHVMGLVIPKSWTDAVGIHQHVYHLVAVIGGLLAGVMLVTGLLILIWRRRTVKSVFNATTVNDKVMYVVLGTVIATGMWNTISTTYSDEYNYRLGVGPYFRSIFTFQPDSGLIADAPVQFQIHAVAAFLLFAMWPFTRLVHAFSAPVGYLTRPYVVYRSAGERYVSHSHLPERTWVSPTAGERPTVGAGVGGGTTRPASVGGVAGSGSTGSGRGGSSAARQ